MTADDETGDGRTDGTESGETDGTGESGAGGETEGDGTDANGAGDGRDDGQSSGGTDGSEPGDTMRERANENRLKLWLLLDANRWVVASVPLFVIFAGCALVGAVTPVPFVDAVEASDPIETLFQAFVTATITGVTLVVSINSLVLSQELGPLGDQRERMEGAMSFREDVEDDLDVPAAPPEPSAFLRALVEAVSHRAEDLRDAATGDDGTADRIAAYVDGLREHADAVSDELEDSQFGTFDVLFAALDFNYSWKIYEARRLRNESGDDISEEARAALDDVVNTLTYFGPAREHFKTLYFQWELINLSRAMLYASIPSLVVASIAILYLEAVGAVVGATLGVHNLVWVVSAVSAVALSPFGVLLSFVLRIATVAKRTLSIGPFILRSASRSEDLDWE